MTETKLLSAKQEKDIEAAGAILSAGGLVAIPTETVYGLAANALDGSSVKKIFAAKGRPQDNPLIVHIADMEQLTLLCAEIPAKAYALAEVFWPGPLTMVLKKSEIVPPEISGGLNTVAVRFPSDKTAQAVIRAAGVPLAAPSANVSGRPSPTEFIHVQQDLSGRVDAIMDGGACEAGVESTVLTLARPVPKLLRPGVVTREQIEAVIGEIAVDAGVSGKGDAQGPVASPGMKYKHYSPKTRVSIIDASPAEFTCYANQRYLQGQSAKDLFALCFEEDTQYLEMPCVTYGTRYDREKQAHTLFAALHALDTRGAVQAYARMPSKAGIGAAVYNRLLRAAGHRVVNPLGHYIVGLTGASGAGKTTVAAAAGLCGVVDCDAISKSPGIYDTACITELQQAYGKDVAPGGILNRKLLAERAFSNQANKRKLNAITHPRILSAVNREIEVQLKGGKHIVLVDAPTLFESGFDRYCARILVVTAGEEVRLKRIMARDGITEQAARARMAAQYPQTFYTARADYIVSGETGTDKAAMLEPMLAELHDGLKNTARIPD